MHMTFRNPSQKKKKIYCYKRKHLCHAQDISLRRRILEVGFTSKNCFPLIIKMQLNLPYTLNSMQIVNKNAGLVLPFLITRKKTMLWISFHSTWIRKHNIDLNWNIRNKVIFQTCSVQYPLLCKPPLGTKTTRSLILVS